MDKEGKTGDSPPRRYKWRYGLLRLVMPWLCVAVGIFMAARGALELSANGSDVPFFLILGASLILLGVIAFFVYRWMAKRGL